jgi:sterol desaturase/sphingolipid hydroxylase (fatty acid hydroxylase superfamily)
MALFSVEHGKAAYWADFAIYGVAVAMLAVVLAVYAPRAHWAGLASSVVLGFAAWTLLEYALHRFVLHGLEPFLSWHAEHHARPTALMSTPTLLSVALVALLVFLPVLWAAGLWRAAAFTLGVTGGYLAYALTHHATHHWRSRGAWMTRRKRWHALHHHTAGCYGVSTSFWDRVFGSAGRNPEPGLRIVAERSTPWSRPKV